MSNPIYQSIKNIKRDIDQIKVGERPAIRPPYAQRLLNPFPLASSGAGAGDFPQRGALSILVFHVSVYVQTTNNGTNYWTLALVNTAATVLASVNTSAIGANTWARLSTTTITQPSSTNVSLIILATATLSPGSIYIVPEILVLPT